MFTEEPPAVLEGREQFIPSLEEKTKEKIPAAPTLGNGRDLAG